MVELHLLSVASLILSCPTPAMTFSTGRGFGKNSNNSNDAFVSFDRFRATCPASIAAIRQFDPSLIQISPHEEEKVKSDKHLESEAQDVWVAVYRSSNNLPSVFVRDSFFDAMASSTTVPEGDSETLVSLKSTFSSGVVESTVVLDDARPNSRPVAVARLTRSSESPDACVIDSMRCTLKKEDADPDCDGGSEHAEAIGVCIDELVLSYLRHGVGRGRRFDGGIRFRGTLVSGKLLEARGFREVRALSSDMHSHESDLDGALEKYAERSASKKVAKNPGGRDRALKIVSYLAKVNREEDLRRRRRDDERVRSLGGEEDEDERDFDPWASVKKYL